MRGASRARRERRDRRVQGGRGLPPPGRRRRARRAGAHRGRAAVRRRAHVLRAGVGARAHVAVRRPASRSRTPASARPPTSSSSRPPPRSCSASTRPASPTTCSPRRCSRPGRRCWWPGDAHRDVGAPRGAGEPRDAAAPRRARGRSRVGPPRRRRRRRGPPRRSRSGSSAAALALLDRPRRPRRRAGARHRGRHPGAHRRGAHHHATGRRASRATRSPRSRPAGARPSPSSPPSAGPVAARRRGRARSRPRRRCRTRSWPRRRASDVIVMAAAVADFRPKAPRDRKLKKHDGIPEIVLEPTHDFLVDLGARQARRPGAGRASRPRPTTSSTNAADKLRRKRLDLIVGNDVAQPDAGFEVDTNRAVMLDADGAVRGRCRCSPKIDARRRHLDRIAVARSRCSDDPPIRAESPEPAIRGHRTTEQAHLHVGVGHRRPPRQDGDQISDARARRRPRAGPARAASRARRWSRPASCVVAGEISTKAHIDFPRIARDTICEHRLHRRRLRLRRQDLRRHHLDRRAVARHRDGRRQGDRAARRAPATTTTRSAPATRA